MRAKFSEIFEDVTRKGRKLPTDQYHESGKYPIYDQGQNTIAGYTDEADGLFTDVPAYIFGDHTRVIKYVDTPCFLGADGVKLLKAKDETIVPRYLYYALLSVDIPNTGYNRHFKWLKEANIKIVDADEQSNIVKRLNKIEHLISLRKQQLAKLDELVKARFVEMFRNRGYPTVKLGAVCSKITDGTHKTPSYQAEGITFISAKNIIGNEIDFSDVKYILESEYQEIQNRCQTAKNDIVLTKSGTLGVPAVVRTEQKLGLFESLAILKYDRQKLLPEFLCEQLKSDEVQRQFAFGTKGIAVKHLHLGVIADTVIIIPPMALQTQFAAFVQATDQTKSTIQASLDELETLKKSLMQEYFG